MNAEVKQQWVDALRSGDYKQGHGYLQSDDKFCCLGVLCDLAVKAGVTTAEETDFGTVVYGAESDDSNTAYPPHVVREWAGGLEMSPKVPFEHPEWSSGEYTKSAPLTAINDSGKGDFNVIADLIEEHL